MKPTDIHQRQLLRRMHDNHAKHTDRDMTSAAMEEPEKKNKNKNKLQPSLQESQEGQRVENATLHRLQHMMTRMLGPAGTGHNGARHFRWPIEFLPLPR